LVLGAGAARTASTGNGARMPGRGYLRGAGPPGGARIFWSACQPPVSAYAPDHPRPSPVPAADIQDHQASTLDDRQLACGGLANVTRRAGRLVGRSWLTGWG